MTVAYILCVHLSDLCVMDLCVMDVLVLCMCGYGGEGMRNCGGM